MDWIQRKAASLPFASAAGGSIFLLLFAFGGAAAALFFVKKKRTGRSLAAVALCAVLCLSMAEIERAFTTRLTVVSSRGSSLILVSQGGRIAAFCSGRLRADRFYQTAQQALDRLGGDRVHQLWLTNPAGTGWRDRRAFCPSWPWAKKIGFIKAAAALRSLAAEAFCWGRAATLFSSWRRRAALCWPPAGKSLWSC